MRGQLLTTGPLAVIAVCYAITAPSSSPARLERFLPSGTSSQSAQSLSADCRKAAAALQRQLPGDWNIVIREPFVVAGDCSIDQLERHHRDTIAPIARALSVQYFDVRPTWPITVAMCSSEDSYRECNRCLGGRDRNEYSGTYSRTEHRVIANMATGEGTLAHELAHALAHGDFPELPEWLDEGLASLHEECEFSPDGLRLVGQENWRGEVLLAAWRRKELRSVAEMASEPFATDNALVDYAQARYFCLFLQRQHLLEAYYRKCRSHAKQNRNGLMALAELMETDDLQTIDLRFQQWLATLKPAGERR